MQERFTLRFETGERAGEAIPVPAAGMTVGRRAGNTLVIADASVSGRHAELAVEGDGLRLRDLGSTNGTRVGGQKISEARLAHGDRVLFGSIGLSVEDARLTEAGTSRASRAAGAPSASAAGEGVARLDTASLQRAGRRPRTGAALLVLVLAAAGAAAWYLLGGGAESGGARTRPVEPVPGNLLAQGFSFEQDAGGWENAPGAEAFFERSPAARYGGTHGMRAAPAPGERAHLVSAAGPVREGSTLRLTARLRVSGQAAGRIGIELLGAQPAEGGEPASTAAFGPWIGDISEHDALELEVPVPAGFERARALAQAVSAGEGEGRVDLDDVALVAGLAAREPDARLAEHRLYLLGRPPQTLQLQKLARPLLGNLRVELFEEDSLLPRDVPLRLVPEEGRIRLLVELPESLPEGAQSRLVLRGEEVAVTLGLATLSGEGYQLRSLEFDQEDVHTLLLGDGADLVGLAFEEPVRVRSRAQGGAASIEIRPAPAELVLQLDFGAERAEAGRIAFAARNAQGAGRLGEALATWGRLLATAPYERRLVDEAQTARGRLVSEGLAELAQVERELDRARFFRLADLYRRARAQARAIGARYSASEVETRAAALASAIGDELGGLETDLARGEIERLRSIRAVLEAQGSTGLASAVGSYLSETYGVDVR